MYEPRHEEHAHIAEQESVREPFGIVQGVSLCLGIFFVVIGAVGLARSGMHSLVRPAEFIGPFRATPLLSLLHLIAGLFALGSAAGRAAARGTMMGLGPLLLAFGIIAVIQPIRSLGYEPANGVVYIVAGAIALAAAIVTPYVIERRSVTTI
jgi:hypothetical protein